MYTQQQSLQDQVDDIKVRLSRLEDKLANVTGALPRPTKRVVRPMREIFEWAQKNDVTWDDDGSFEDTDSGALWDPDMWRLCGEVVVLEQNPPYEWVHSESESYFLDEWTKEIDT